MRKFKRFTFLLVICGVIAGCSDYYSQDGYSHRRHYSDLPYCPGEPVEIETIGTTGVFVNVSHLPMQEARQQQRDNPFVHNVYEVDSQGYVYP